MNITSSPRKEAVERYRARCRARQKREVQREEEKTIEQKGEELAYSFKRLSQYKSVEQEWSIICQFCGCCFLKSTTTIFRNKCCFNGTYQSKMPMLEELLPSIANILEEDLTYFSSASSSYNNILALGEIETETAIGKLWIN